MGGRDQHAAAAGLDAMGDGNDVAARVRNPRPPRRPAHRSGSRQRLKKRHLPLGHELRLRSALVVLRSEEIVVEEDWVGCGSVGGNNQSTEITEKFNC